MFGSYSFINVVGGKEEKDDDGRSRRNMVEVAIVIKILKNLYTGVHIDSVYLCGQCGISKCSICIFVVNVYLTFSFIFTAWQESQKKLTIGVISPYAAQVASIQEKLAHKYQKLDGFSVKVKSIDGFQGGKRIVMGQLASYHVLKRLMLPGQYVILSLSLQLIFISNTCF